MTCDGIDSRIATIAVSPDSGSNWYDIGTITSDDFSVGQDTSETTNYGDSNWKGQILTGTQLTLAVECVYSITDTGLVRVHDEVLVNRATLMVRYRPSGATPTTNRSRTFTATVSDYNEKGSQGSHRTVSFTFTSCGAPTIQTVADD